MGKPSKEFLGREIKTFGSNTDHIHHHNMPISRTLLAFDPLLADRYELGGSCNKLLLTVSNSLSGRPASGHTIES